MTDKKSVKEIVIMVAILVAIALVAGALLAVMYNVTKLTDEEIAARNDKIFQSVYAAKSYEKLEIDADFGANITDVRRTDDGSYIFVVNGEGGYGGSVQFYVAVSGEQIVNIVIGEHGETPGKYDAVVKESHWSQYTGVELKKEFTLGSDITAVSGSTRTSTAMNNAVNAAVVYFANVLNKAQTYWTAEANVDELILHPTYTMTNIADSSKVAVIEFGYAFSDDGSMYGTIKSIKLNDSEVDSALIGANVETGEFTSNGDAEQAALEAVNLFNLKYSANKINSLYRKVEIQEGSTKGNAVIKAYAGDFSGDLYIEFTIKDGVVTSASLPNNDGNMWAPISKQQSDFEQVKNQFVGENVESLIKAGVGTLKPLEGGDTIVPHSGATVTSTGMVSAAQLASRAYLITFSE